MTTTARGRHRRSPWLGFGPVAAFLALLALAVALAPTAVAAPGLQAEYGGSRWEHANRAICVQTKDIRNAAVRDAVKRSVSSWGANTKLDIRHRWDCQALGYSQIVVVTARHYGNTGWSGRVEHKGGLAWKQVKTAGSWTKNGWTYVKRSPVAVRINRSSTDGMSSARRQHVVSHELGHALGLGHTSSCKSVMVKSWNCGYMYKYGGWWDWVGKSTNPGINQIYAKG